MQNILALQAMELDATADAYEGPAWSTLSIRCCTVTYAELETIIPPIGS